MNVAGSLDAGDCVSVQTLVWGKPWARHVHGDAGWKTGRTHGTVIQNVGGTRWLCDFGEENGTYAAWERHVLQIEVTAKSRSRAKSREHGSAAAPVEEHTVPPQARPLLTSSHGRRLKIVGDRWDPGLANAPVKSSGAKRRRPTSTAPLTPSASDRLLGGTGSWALGVSSRTAPRVGSEWQVVTLPPVHVRSDAALEPPPMALPSSADQCIRISGVPSGSRAAAPTGSDVARDPGGPPLCLCDMSATWEHGRWWCAHGACSFEAAPPPSETPWTPLCHCDRRAVWLHQRWWCALHLSASGGCGFEAELLRCDLREAPTEISEIDRAAIAGELRAWEPPSGWASSRCAGLFPLCSTLVVHG
jgi:hypothetical protein